MRQKWVWPTTKTKIWKDLLKNVFCFALNNHVLVENGQETSKYKNINSTTTTNISKTQPVKFLLHMAHHLVNGCLLPWLNENFQYLESMTENYFKGKEKKKKKD